jgi:hypothetical protein
MTWTRKELSERLLEHGEGACDRFAWITDQEVCVYCDHTYAQHLTKHAAEEIGVLDAEVIRLTRVEEAHNSLYIVRKEQTK